MFATAANADTAVNDTIECVYEMNEVYVYKPKEHFALSQQPLSSTSFNQGQLKNLNVNSLQQLSAYVPSFTMPVYGSRLTSAMYIRGIGSRVNSPAVGLYVDGMPIQSKSAMNFHVYDAERIDVLRGPQGTLYGMNSEGGLIRFFSKHPMTYKGTDLKLSVGNKFTRTAEVAHYGQVNDKLAFSIAGFYNGQNGFLHNKFNGERADAFNEFGGKGRFVWTPTDRLTFDFIADYQYMRQNGFAYGQIVTPEQIATANIMSPYYGLKAGTQDPNQNRQSNYRRNMLNTGLGIKYLGNGFALHSMTTWQFLKDYMMMDIDYLPMDFIHIEQRQHQNSLTQELAIKSRNDKAWQWTFGAFGSYQWLKTNAPVMFDKDMNKVMSKAITQYAYTGMLAAMAKRIAARLIAAGVPAEQAAEQAKIAAAAAILKAGGVNITMDMGTIPGLFHTPTLNLGVYHESNIDLTSRLRATLGLRYDYSNVEIDYATSARIMMNQKVMGQEVNSVISSMLAHKERNHFGQLLPKVGLTYRFDDLGSNVYATWSKGYRAGGYNIQMFSDILQTELSAASRTARGSLDIAHDEAAYERIARTIAYEPETSFNYEVGTHLKLNGGKLNIDLAGFYMQIHNQQLSVMAGNYGFGRMMTNAGKSHSCGVEASVRGEALNNKLSYAVSYGFTSAQFDEYADSTALGKMNYKDKRVPFIPQHTLGATADYLIAVSPDALLDPTNKFHLRSVTVGLNLAAQGNTYWDEANTLSQNFYATLGAHADGDFGPMHINLWIRNLTDTRYNTFAVQSGATGQKFAFAQLGNPFQMGVDFTFHF